MINITVPNLDKVMNDISKELAKVTTDKFVTVGVHQDDNARPDQANNAQIGAMNHFGTDRIPARPWLDVGVASASQEVLDTIAEAIEDGEQMDVALNRVGLVAVAGVQNYMDELSSPSNAPSTVKRKGTDNPLVDTGELKQSVNYKITNTKPSEGL
jgi:hypothetical protein